MGYVEVPSAAILGVSGKSSTPLVFINAKPIEGA